MVCVAFINQIKQFQAVPGAGWRLIEAFDCVCPGSSDTWTVPRLAATYVAGPGAAIISAGAGAGAISWMGAGAASWMTAGDEEIASEPGADEIAYPAGIADGGAAKIATGAPAAPWIVVSAIGIAEALMQTTNAIKRTDVMNWNII